MHRLGLTFLLMALAATPLTAQVCLQQEQNDSQRVAYLDSLTYRQYLEGDYRELISTSLTAEEEGIGFYYLNYRTAIAHYALKNYAKAAEYYRRTLTETPDDPALKEGLYYAYLLSGQKQNASLLAKTLAPHTQATIGIKETVVDNLSLSGGYLMNDNNPDNLSPAMNNDSLNQYQDMVFSALGIGFNLSERTKLKLGYQFYNTRFQRSVASTLTKEEHLSQHQLVAALEFFTPHNVTWGFSGGYYNIETINNNLSSPATGTGGYGAGLGGNNTPAGYTSATTTRNSAYSLLAFLNKRFTYTLPEIAVAYSNFGGIGQYQAKGSLTYYPLGNLNFYGITSAAMIHTPKGWTTEQYILSQHLGVRLFKQIWLDANGSFGNHLNYITDRSFLVYDTYDPIQGMAGLTLSWYLKSTTLSTGYQWQQKEGYAYSTTGYTAYRYNNHLVNIAWLWNF